jgi:hypothetical protein
MSADDDVPTPTPPKLPEVEQESTDEILAAAPSIDEIIKAAEPVEDVLAAEPSVEELLGRDREEPPATPPDGGA